jgi:hypothetical protein
LRCLRLPAAASCTCSCMQRLGATGGWPGAAQGHVTCQETAVIQHDPRHMLPCAQSRRSTLASITGAAAMVSAAPAFAAYGDSANVFGRVTNTSGFIPYAGDGFAVLLPGKWNPSKEQDFPGVQLRCAGVPCHVRRGCDLVHGDGDGGRPAALDRRISSHPRSRPRPGTLECRLRGGEGAWGEDGVAASGGSPACADAPPRPCCRYEDNGDAVNNFVVLKNPTDKGKMSDFGDKAAFLNSVSYLLGRQAYSGAWGGWGGAGHWVRAGAGRL